MADDLNAMSVLVAVAETRSFRRAGERLGVSTSAVSQALRRLEDRLGVVLAHRTTRSVRLTEPGERLYAAVRPALEEVRTAVAAVRELSAEPHGTLRIVVASGAEDFLRGPELAGFLTTHPGVRLDVTLSNAVRDIVASGYDAGIQLGEVIDRDMIAVPVTGQTRLVVVAAPSYFKHHPTPRHPRDLVHHQCLNWHGTPDDPPYRWEFTENGKDFAVAVSDRALSTDAALLIHLARAGLGVTMAYEGHARDAIERGELVPVLEEFSTPFPGFYLYYPERRQASPPLRALVDYLRQKRRGARSKRSRRGVARSRRGKPGGG
ncbi:MAG: LysR family transcriptional regulator [Gemmatimonadaceae bacterium]